MRNGEKELYAKKVICAKALWWERLNIQWTMVRPYIKIEP